MKSLKLIVVSAIIALSACSSEKKENTTETKTEQIEQTAEYTCPMHPEVKSDKPGDCPKCGMKLEKANK